MPAWLVDWLWLLDYVWLIELVYIWYRLAWLAMHGSNDYDWLAIKVDVINTDLSKL